MKRKQVSILITGAKGTGKTTKLIELVNTLEATGAKICFVYNGTGEEKIEVYKQVKIEDIYTTNERMFRINYTSKNNLFKRLEAITKPQANREQKRICLVFDDGMFFIKSKDYDLENILRTQRQRNLDVCFVTHGISEIPAMFWGFFNCMLLFKTTDKASRSIYKVPTEFLDYADEVNRSGNEYYNKFISFT